MAVVKCQGTERLGNEMPRKYYVRIKELNGNKSLKRCWEEAHNLSKAKEYETE